MSHRPLLSRLPQFHRFICACALPLLLAACATPPGPSIATGNDAPMAEAAAGPRATPPAPVLPRGPLAELPVKAPAAPGGVATLQATTDLWERIRRGFAMPDLDTELVRDREQWYGSRPDYIQRMTERSRKYLFHIVEEIERRNLPTELALLPFIESAFNPQAVSSARAAGMWQFMPATGQSFDLKQNAFRDDRRDVLASTRAALDYLQQLYARFGDWHLALAAYNWGQGNVNRAITRNQRDGQPTDYTSLSMPTETRYYVPKLQAVKNIVAQPQRFSATLPDIGNHPFFDTVPIERDMDVAVIARLAEVDERDFRALNPSVNQPVVMAAGTPQVLLPWDNAGIFTRNLMAHQGPVATWTAWRAPATMTPAEAAARLGMSEAELRRVNGIPPRMLVRAGSTLLVHRNDKRNADVPEHLADNGQLLLQPEQRLRRVQVKARKGETLAALARRHGVNAVDAARWNKLAVNASLKTGQLITLHLPQRATAAAPATRTTSKAASNTASKTTPTAPRISTQVSASGSKKAVAQR